MSRHLVPFGEGAAFEENLASCFCLLLYCSLPHAPRGKERSAGKLREMHLENGWPLASSLVQFCKRSLNAPSPVLGSG